MKPAVKETLSVSDVILSFLTLTRHQYFNAKFSDYLEFTKSQNQGEDISEEQITDSLLLTCDDFFYKLVYFLRTQNQTLTSEDIADIYDAFFSMLDTKEMDCNGATIKVEDLIDWEDHIEILLLESQNIVLPGGRFGIDTAIDLAITTVSNDLEAIGRQNLIDTFRRQVRESIMGTIGLEDHQTEELLARLEYYCNQVFPTNCKVFSDFQEFQHFLFQQITEFVEENVPGFNTFLMQIDQIEEVALRIFSEYDGIIKKHATELRQTIHASTGIACGSSLQEIKTKLVQLWLQEHIEINQPNDDYSDTTASADQVAETN